MTDLLIVGVPILLVLFVSWLREERPTPIQNWRPSDDDARSGRRYTLFTRPKNWRSK